MDMVEGSNARTDIAPSRSVVRRVVQVMESFTTQQRWGVRELAVELGIPKSGLHRTLQEMAAENLITADDDGAYSVASKMLRLASGLMQAADLSRVAYDHLRSARDATGETALLAAYDSGRQQVIAIDAALSHNPIQFVWGALREWTDLHLSASGLGILAFLPPNEQERYFATPRVNTQGARVTLKAIAPTLEEIRERGWAISRGQRVPGTTGVCAPIIDGRNRIAGAVIVVWPDRPVPVDEELVGRTCAASAHATSLELGWSGASNKPHANTAH